MGPGSAAHAQCVINISSHETGRPAGRGGDGARAPWAPPVSAPGTDVGVVICTCVAKYGDNIRCTRRACKCEYENSCIFVDGAPHYIRFNN